MRHFPTLAVLAFAFVVPARSEAANSHTAQQKAAKKACASGDFRKGVEILAELYVDTDNATHIFNQGRCYEQNHQWVSAIDRFREYLRKSNDAAPADRADAEKHIADCETFRKQEEPTLAPPPLSPAPPAPVVLPSPAPGPTANSEPVGVAHSVPPAKPRRSGLRVAGIITGSLGVATAVTGLVLNLKANGLADDFNRTREPATKASYSSYKTGSMVCYGAGAGALVAGVVLYLVGRSSGATPQSSQYSLLPVFTSSQYSLAVARVF